MDERTKKAFEFASDVIKQFITLSTGIVGLTVTFSKDLLKSADHDAKVWAIWMWVCFLASIFFGMLGLQALTGILGSPEVPEVKHERVFAPNVSLFVGIQVVAFLGGTVLAVVFAVKGMP